MRLNACRMSACMAMIAGATITFHTVSASGRFHGVGRFERIKGNPAAGYKEVVEADLFISPAASPPTGPSRRLGTTQPTASSCMTKWPPGGGVYCANVEAGTHSMLLNQPEWFIGHAKILPDLTIADLETQEINVELPIDYSTYFQVDNQWTGGDSTWYQTYTATGLSVTGVSFVLAGQAPSAVDVSILEDNGNPDPVTWTVLGTRSPAVLCADCDNWVKWRSGEIATVPGRKYAIRLSARGGTMSPYKRDKDTWSYVGGRAYSGNGTAQSFDLNCVVFADNDGTFVTVQKRTGGSIGTLHDLFSEGWGQTFVAKGNGLAGADLWAAGPGTYDVDFTWRILDGGPDGPQIGPTKTTQAASLASTTGLHGVSYSHGEVPLVRGQTYFIEFFAANSSGFDPYMTNDPYDGRCYRWIGASWVEQPVQLDIAMTIIEYSALPLIELSRKTINRSLFVGGSLSSDVFTVTNVGYDTLLYEVSDDAAWLSVNPTSGSSTGEADTITVSYSVASLPVGQHSATVTVTGTDNEGGEVINSPQTVVVTVSVTSVKPDFDGDRDVDLDDFGHLQKCMTGDGVPVGNPDCLNARLDGDNDVDQDDYLIFANCLSGANILADPDCD